MSGSQGSLDWVFFSFQAFCDKRTDSQKDHTAAASGRGSEVVSKNRRSG